MFSLFRDAQQIENVEARAADPRVGVGSRGRLRADAGLHVHRQGRGAGGRLLREPWNLADDGVDLSDAPDGKELREHFRTLADIIAVTARVFRGQDDDTVHELIPKIESDERHYEDHVTACIRSEEPGTFAAPRALLYRYLKRISAHLSNLLTSLVMPVDRLDFYKKSKAVDNE